jgi:hypothetical protein
VIVPADHMNVHRHPLAVLEVRRILLEHLHDLQARSRAALPDANLGAVAPPATVAWPNVPVRAN